jgi:ATP-binding cassette subfamily B protein
VDFIGAVGIAVVIFFFGAQTITGMSASGQALTVGVLAAFIQYSQQLFQPIRDLSDKFNILQAAIVASHRIFVLLDLDIEIKTPRSRNAPAVHAARSNFKTSGSLTRKMTGS